MLHIRDTMYVTEVIPLTLLPQSVPQVLSYISDELLEIGSVVKVLVHRRSVSAVVVSSASLESQRIRIKRSDFRIKKISAVLNPKPQVSPFQLKLALWLSKTYYSPLGSCLKAVLPNFFLKKNLNLPSQSKPSDIAAKTAIYLTHFNQLAGTIISDINKSISLGQSVLILLPDQTYIEYLDRELNNYYPVTTYTSGLSAGLIYQAWQSASENSPRVFLTTRAGLFLPFNNLGLIIMSDPDHESYKSDQLPRYESRRIAEFLSSWHNAKLILAVPLLSVSDYKVQKDLSSTISINLKQPRPAIEIIDIATEIQSGNWRLMSRKLADDLKKSIIEKERILFFSTRKGYLTLLTCQNCGIYFRCDNCSGPMRVYKFPEPSLICHHCLLSKKYPTYCPNCKSNKLRAVGLPGTDRIAEGVEQFLAENNLSAPLTLLDSSIVSNYKAEKQLSVNLRIAGPSVTVASQMIFSYLADISFDYISIVSADGLISLPDYKSYEHLAYIIEKLIQFRPRKLLIQSFQADHPLWDQVQVGTYNSLYESELAARQQLGYPPFTRIAKLTYRHSDKKQAYTGARKLAETLKLAISQQKLTSDFAISGPSPAFIARERGYYIYHLILKINPESKPELILRYVTRGWSIDLDPRNLI